jgi:hypothetical protein
LKYLFSKPNDQPNFDLVQILRVEIHLAVEHSLPLLTSCPASEGWWLSTSALTSMVTVLEAPVFV